MVGRPLQRSTHVLMRAHVAGTSAGANATTTCSAAPPSRRAQSSGPRGTSSACAACTQFSSTRHAAPCQRAARAFASTMSLQHAMTCAQRSPPASLQAQREEGRMRHMPRGAWSCACACVRVRMRTCSLAVRTHLSRSTARMSSSAIAAVAWQMSHWQLAFEAVRAHTV